MAARHSGAARRNGAAAAERNEKKDLPTRGATDVNSVNVCGIHAVSAMLQEKRVKRLFVADNGGGSRVRALCETAEADGVPIIRQSREALATRGQEQRHQGVVAEARLPTADLPALIAGTLPLVVLDGVTDPRNLGAIMRVARAFGAAAVLSPARRAAPLSAVTLRAAAGAAAQLPLARVPNIARALRQMDAAGRTIIGAAEDGARGLFDAPLPAGACWVFGDEGGGLRRLTREHCHETVRIPTVAGDAGCLNVSTACAICLAAATRVGWL